MINLRTKWVMNSVMITMLLLIGYAGSAFAIQGPVQERVKELESKNAFRVETKLFSAVSNASLDLVNVVRTYEVVKANSNLTQLLITQPDYLKLTLPDGNKGTLTVLLYKVNISPNGLTLLTSDGRNISNPNTVLNYRGTLNNDEGSVASFTFSQEESMGLISTHHGNYVVGRIKNSKEGLYIIYNDNDLIPHNTFECGTAFSLPQGYTDKGANPSAQTTKCVNWYYEIDNDIYLDKDSLAGVNSYIQGIFNQVSTLYANDGITINLQTVYVWTTVDPYISTSTMTLLTQFGTVRTSFAGDLAHLVGYKGGGGIAWVGGLCNSTQYRMAYSGIWDYYSNVPLYSWTVEVMAHEEGHLFGSNHTHDCAWNGNNSRIDNCGPAAGYNSGTCAAGPIPAKGTIMSYCHLYPNPGIDLTLGFGPLPKTLMVNNINNASCLAACATGCAVPPQPGAVSGITSVCAGSSQTYSIAAVSGATSYTWIVPSGWTGTSTTNSISVTAGNSAGTISVKAVNICGSSTAKALTVTMASSPAQPGAITGSVYGLCGQNTVAFSVPLTSGVTYNWTLPAGATVVTGQGSNSITANFATATVTSGYVNVSANNTCGASALRKKAIKTTPTAPVSLTGSTSVCPNSTGNPYSTTPVATATAYVWTAPSGSHISDGSITSSNNTLTTSATSVTINYGTFTSTSKVTVKAKNACGNSAAKAITLVPQSCRESELLSGTNTTVINLFPNPAHDQVTLTIDAASENNYLISVIDMTGKTIFTDNKNAKVGTNQFNYDLQHFARGLYLLRVQSKDDVKFSRLEIQ